MPSQQEVRWSQLKVGVIVAPIFPVCTLRPDIQADLHSLASVLAEIEPDHIYGESLHVRGENVGLIESAIGEPLRLTAGFDKGVSELFRAELHRAGLRGTWWPES